MIRAVRGVSFKVFSGDTLCIVGESGSGKSTLISALALSLPPNAVIERGDIIYLGIDLLRSKREIIEKIRGREIIMIFQDPVSVFSPLHTVGEHLLDLAKNLRGFRNKEEALKYILDVFTKLRLPDPFRILRSYPHELSGGMLQRVALASVLIAKPKILLADEPTTMLDATIQLQILRLLKDLVNNENLTLIMVTHNFGVAREICKKTFVMYAGIVLEEGYTEDVIKRPLHPYTQSLIKAIPRTTHHIGRIRHIPGEPPDLRKTFEGCPFVERCEYMDEKCKTWRELVNVGNRKVYCKLYGGLG
ncbi:MAG: ABC transporter ATP-binding protein [Sulfolobales archaeon]